MTSVLTFSEVGDHQHNEDAFAVQPHPRAPDVILCFVADGQGGRAGGSEAAKLACRYAIEKATPASPEELVCPRFWIGLLRDLDRSVSDDSVAGFTTFVGLAVVGDRVVGVSHGDSAALLLTGNEASKLTFGQHKNPPVGSGGAEAVTFRAVLRPAWKLVVMTDGVWKYVGWGRVVEIARRESGDALMRELQQAARLPGSGRFQDDFTVVLLESNAREYSKHS